MSTTFQVHIVTLEIQSIIQNLYYRVSAQESFTTTTPFELLNKGSNHEMVYSLLSVDETTGATYEEADVFSAVSCQTETFNIQVFTHDESLIGRYKM